MPQSPMKLTRNYTACSRIVSKVESSHESPFLYKDSKLPRLRTTRTLGLRTNHISVQLANDHMP